MRVDTEILLKQFEPIKQKYNDLRRRTQYDDFSDITVDEGQTFVTMCLACINRVAGAESVYADQAKTATSRVHSAFWHASIPEIYGITESLRVDVQNGHLTTLRELVHAEVFSDFLENAEYFVSEGHKDPAAVIAGSVLEDHLRKLCDKNGLPTTSTDHRGDVRPKKADTLNADLKSASIYNLNQQKLITAWLDTRNSAAHGKYSEYVEQVVVLMIQGIRQLINQYPA